MLGPAMSNTDTQDSPWPGLGGSRHLPPYNILCGWPRSLHPNGSFSWDSQVGVMKLSRVGVSGLWELISPDCKVRSRRGLNQSCISLWELSNAMLHSRIRCQEEVDSWLLMVRSQTASLTLGPSFAHNLGCKCPNGSCKAILDMYTSNLSNDIKNVTSRWVLTPQIALWSFGSPPGLHLPKWELPWECERSLPHTPSHFLTLQGSMWCDSLASS
jgi:hypothetical protein